MEEALVTTETRSATAAEAFRHIAELLQVGNFQVQYAKHVSDACAFLEHLAKTDEEARANQKRELEEAK